MKKINIVKLKHFIPSIFIIIVSILVSIPMFMPNFNMQFDDGVQHICRLIGTSQSIKEGQIFPMIMSKLCNGFGYSWNIFYSPLTAYTPLIFRVFGLSYTMCLKFFMLLVSILTGFSMYFFINKILNNKLEDKKVKLIAILASVLYILAPYRLNDMYLRQALSELVSFIFLPVIFNGLYSIINLKERKCTLILGTVGMILTHSMLTVYVAMFCFIYLIVNIKKLDKKTILYLIFNAIMILSATSFYWATLLEAKLSTDYEVFNQDHMIRWKFMIMLKPNVLELFATKGGRMMYGLGIVTIWGCILSLAVIKNIKEKGNYILFLALGIITTIMALDIFPFEKLPSIFTMMQFSFRMLEFSSFFLTVIASISIGITFDKFNIYAVLLLISISIILLIPNIKYLPKGEYYKEEDLIQGISVTKETQRVHAGCASFEYLPSKAFKNRSYIEQRQDNVVVLQGKVNITGYSKENTNLSFKIKEVEENTKLELPYIFYIGYSAKLEKEDGTVQNLQIEESDNGFCMITVPNTNGTIKVSYTGTTLMIITYIVTIISFIYIVYYFWVLKR